MMGNTPATVLVLYQQGFLPQYTVKAIESLRSNGYIVRACYENKSDTTKLRVSDITELFYNIEKVVLISLPLYILNRISKLDDGHPIAAIVIYALCSGLLVELFEDGIDPRCYLLSKENCFQGMNQLLDNMLTKLRNMGVVFLKAKEMQTNERDGPHRVVTAHDVKNAMASKSIITVRKQDVITPLALELIKSMKKEI